METSVRVLCLGGKKFFWNSIKIQLLEDLSVIGIDVIFYTNTYASISTSEHLRKTIALIRPDIIIVDGNDFNNKETLEALSKHLKAFSDKNLPIFVVSSDEKKTFSAIQKSFSTLSCQLVSVGKLTSVPSQALLFRSNIDFSTVALSALPKFENSRTQLEREPDLLLRHISKKSSGSVLWDGESLSGKVLLKKINGEHGTAFKLEKTFGYQKEGVYFLTSGIPIENVDTFWFESVQISHFISLKSFKRKGNAYQNFLKKIARHCHAGMLEKVTHLFDKESIVRSNVRISVEAHYTVLTEIFTFLLRSESFDKISLRQNTQLAPDQVLLLISVGDEQDQVLINGSSRSFPLNQKLLKHFSNNFKNYAHLLKVPFQTQQIHQQFKLLSKRHSALKQEYLLKVETESLDEKDQYIHFIANRKIDIIQNLLEQAKVIDPLTETGEKLSEKSALIFFDQRRHAEILNENLKQIEDKKIFLNVSEKLTSFKDLLSLETDDLELFLTRGIVLCTKTCKIMLEHNLKKILYYLEKNKEQNLSVTIRKLHHEISQCKNKLQDFVFLKICSEFEKKLSQVRSELLQKMEGVWKKKISDIASQTKGKKISVFSNREETSKLMQQAITMTLPQANVKSKAIDCRLKEAHEPSDLKNFKSLYQDKEQRKRVMEKDLSIQNANRLATFFNRIVLNINNFEPEVVIFNFKNDLLPPLVKILKNTPVINETPILAFTSPDISIENFQNLLKMGVFPMLLPLQNEGSVSLYSRMLTQLLSKATR